MQWLTLSNDDCSNEKISVIIPARNEEKDIAASVQSILDQKNVDVSVIIVNDHSTDHTKDIIEKISLCESRVTVINDPPLKPGWLGKCNAMQHAAAFALDDLLLFTDADIIHHPHSFSKAVKQMKSQKYDFISLFPLFIHKSFWEHMNIPLMFFAFAQHMNFKKIGDAKSNHAVACGSFMLVKQDVFNAIHGFESVKTKMFDDVEFAKALKSKSYRLGFYFAPELLNVQLFKDNSSAFWGTTKNILTAVNGNKWLALSLIPLGICQYWVPLFTVLYGVATEQRHLYLVGLVTYLIQYLSFFTLSPFLNFNPITLIFFPLSQINATSCLIKAIYHQTKGAVLWRGRAIQITTLLENSHK
ncbi:MAG: glycosyltransferase [Fibrobacterales bacterium]